MNAILSERKALASGFSKRRVIARKSRSTNAV